MYIFVSAFVLGIFGSLHCLGMCGPIAMNLPLGDTVVSVKIQRILIYNFGRVFTYALGGALFGILGMGFRLAGFQQILSISLGVLLLSNLFFPQFIRHFLPNNLLLQNIRTKVINALHSKFASNASAALFLTGVLNGLLPCGLVYAALAASLVTGYMGSGALFMTLFGLGTVPTMFAISYFSGISFSVRARMKRITPIITIVMGSLLIIRGMGLGIPYLSPQFVTTEIPMCHSE